MAMKFKLEKKVLAAAVVVMAGAAAQAGEIKIGFVSSLSGPVSALGIPYEKGIRAALAQHPTIAGHQVKLIVLDDASDPSVAGRNARKLVNEEKVDVLIGTSGVPGAMAVAAVARELKTPLISPTPLTLPGKENDWIVSTSQPFELMVAGVVKRMKASGVKSVAFIGFSDALGDMTYDALVQRAKEAGIKVMANERYARTDSSVTGQVLKLVGMKPDAIMTGGAGTPGALPFLALADRGYKGKTYGQHGLINPDFVRVVGAAGVGALMPTGPVIVAEQLPADSPTRQVALTYREVYQKANGVVPTDAYSSYSFDGWLVFLDAAKRALEKSKAEPGTPQFRQALRDAIFETREVVGTHGVYNFKSGDLYGVDKRARVIVKLDKGGKWTLMP